MALSFSINLDDATFADLSALVDAARSSGAHSDARLALDGRTLSLTISPDTQKNLTVSGPREERDQGHRQADTKPLTFDPNPIKDAVRQVLNDTLLNPPEALG